jgi:hypothetical protein
MLRKKRGCSIKGQEVKGSMAFRFTSPALMKRTPDGAEDDSDMVLRECPISVALARAPQVFDAIPLHMYVSESGSVNWFELSPWAQAAVRRVGAEKARLWDMAEHDRKSKRDSQMGMAVRANR